MSKCYLCNSTKNLSRTDWSKRNTYKCSKCTEKPGKYRAVSELSTASDEWLARAKESHLRLVAKYK